MTRFGPKSRLEDSPSGMLLMAGAILLVCCGFYFSFKAGADHSRFEAEELPEGAMDSVIGSLRENLGKCKAKLAEGGGSGGKARSARVRELEETNANLTNEEHSLMLKHIECMDQREHQKHQWSEEDRLNAALVNELQSKHDGLKGNASHLTKTRGMRLVLLDYSLRKLREENELLRKALGSPTIDMPTHDYYDLLVAKWGAKMNSTHRFVGLRPNRTEFSSIKQRRQTNITNFYERSREKANHKVFFQKKSLATGEYTRPLWNNKTGSEVVVLGVHEKNHITVGSLPRLLRILYDYALCAMHSKEDFIYPAHFKATSSSEKLQLLSSVIDTPLVKFCAGCKPQEHTVEFRLACEGYSSDELYGSIMFWRMRSRIRFTLDILEEADRFIHDKGLENSAAVRLLRKEAVDCKDVDVKPQMSYARLLKRKVPEVSTTHDAQCSPPDDVVVTAINKLVARTKVDRVYLSTDATEDELSNIVAQITVPVVRMETTEDARTQAIDIVVASKSSHLIASRFGITSTQIVELFLLENALRTERVSVW